MRTAVNRLQPNQNQEAEIAKPLSPKKKAVQFFDGGEALKTSRRFLGLGVLVAISTGNKVDKMAVWHEIKRVFQGIGRNLTLTGTKQRWQLQRRLKWNDAS